MSNFGTTAQLEYATKLAVRAGFKSLEAATEQFSGRPTVLFNVTPYTKDQASKVITFLEGKLNIPAKAPKASGKPEGDAPADASAGAAAAEAAKPRAKFLTARHLRLIATHQESPPAELDEDARWVLARLHRLDAIEAMVRRGQPDQRLAVNGNDQIKVAHLIEYFRSEEMTADAFGVSIQTLRAWGQYLPSAHSFKAEVLTNGYVQAPRG